MLEVAILETLIVQNIKMEKGLYSREPKSIEKLIFLAICWEVWSISLEKVINTEDCDVIVKEEATYFQGSKLPSSKFDSLVFFLVFISDVATAHEIGENEDG